MVRSRSRQSIASYQVSPQSRRNIEAPGRDSMTVSRPYWRGRIVENPSEESYRLPVRSRAEQREEGRSGWCISKDAKVGFWRFALAGRRWTTEPNALGLRPNKRMSRLNSVTFRREASMPEGNPDWTPASHKFFSAFSAEKMARSGPDRKGGREARAGETKATSVGHSRLPS